MNETLYPDIRIYLIWIMMKIKLIFLKVFKNIYHNLYIKASHVQLNESIINFFRIQFDLDFCNIEFHTWIQDFTHCAPRQKKRNIPWFFIMEKYYLVVIIVSKEIIFYIMVLRDIRTFHLRMDRECFLNIFRYWCRI